MPDGPPIYRQHLTTRITHRVWAVSLFFLMLTGLQIFNAFPSLHIGRDSGFDDDNVVLSIGAEESDGALRGVTQLLGVAFDPSGVPGVAGGEVRAFPAAPNGHLRHRVPGLADLRALPRDNADHSRLRFHHGQHHGVLQKLAYASVLFQTMPALVGFFVLHTAMILLAGPLNEMRSILTGWYRTDGGKDG